ncbi:sulfur oxidation c-type cytochrome SoxX [Poseidonocella sp. HB161398]|uniref:sulfur oxidation c-type cytochrome SoxX n=1 Tax=Poseidonocella sp. HB161398 TaxID=2320855 RepID=UPI001108E496|nr:sulfur oxidation c-type cytochrome SoxX [Poseidonocella sp. HB161398]
MRQTVFPLAAALALSAGGAAAQTPPEEVVFGPDGAVAASLTGAPGNAEEGALVMADRGLGNCVACHQVAALAADFQGNIGPPLDGAGSRWSEAELRGIVADAKHSFDGSMMPSFYKTGPYIRPGDAYTGKAPAGALPPILTAAQIEDVVAYLATLAD